MALYTFIMDFKGGTYVSQIKAATPKSACVKWAENLETPEVVGLGLKGKDILMKEVKGESPTPLNGVQNAWFATALVRGKCAFIHVIQTEQTFE